MKRAVLLVVSAGVLSACSRGSAPLRFALSFPSAANAQPLSGRVLLFISDDPRTEPRFQADQYRANTTRPIFGVDVDRLAPGQAAIIDSTAFGFPARHLASVPVGDYWVQALFNRYETFQRSDGHTISMPPDQGEGQRWANKPGNLYSKPVKMHVDPSRPDVISIVMDQVVPPVVPPKDTKLVKYITVPNDRLSKFWGRPMSLNAIVLLPAGWDTHPNAHYPVLVHHGHFLKDMAADGWRETPPDANATGQQRTEQELAYAFYQAWNGPHFPRMIHVEVNHANPYFDDSYAVNSANVGPYGDAITNDLLPYIEKQYRGIGQGWARALIGGSTGGWEALGVQIFYPDQYNGAWGLCPDPVDFRAYRSVDIYHDKNAYYYDDNPWKQTPRPGYRDFRDHLYSTFEDRNFVELVLGTHGRSGGQQDIWPAVFGPVGADGYYQPLYDKRTGAIDPDVATYWRDHYDLRYILERDWGTLGPKLTGKLHVYIGTMDNGYLNNAVSYLQAFLDSAKSPAANATVVYGDRYEHCWTGDAQHPNWYGRLTVHQRFMPEMAKWMIKTAPPGADTKSWVY